MHLEHVIIFEFFFLCMQKEIFYKMNQMKYDEKIKS